MKFRITVLATALLLASTCSHALSLGRARGGAVLGQPLDVSFEVRLDAGDETGCLAADVLHGDTPIDASRVRVVLAPGLAGQDTTARVRSAALVDEPVVTVVLRAGCTQRATRRYVLLAELPTDTAAAAAPGPSNRFNPVALPAQRADAAPGSGSATADAAAGAPAAAVSRPRPAFRAIVPAPVPAPALRAASPAASPPPAIPRAAPAPDRRPRLRLDPADLVAEGDALLRPTLELPALSPENPQRRAEAAALWRALNADPADALREAQRVQQMEAELAQLRAQAGRNQAALAQAQQRGDQAAAARYANPLVFALAGLLALLLAVAGWLWYRNRRHADRHWWQDSNLPGTHGASTAVHSRLPDEGPVSVLPPASAGGYSIQEVDLDLSDSALAPLVASPVVRPAAVQPAAAAPVPATAPGPEAAGRSVHPEELFDVQQQADFFVSLGQYDQAIEVLQKHIDEAPARSPLAYLDLLKIFHTLSRSDDYQRIRGQFNALFNGEVPEFAAFNHPARPLDTYADAIATLQAAWGKPEALGVVESLMFRQAGSAGPAFTLEAYRELLLLHGIAKAFAKPTAGGGFNEAGLPMFSESRPAVLSVAPVSASPTRMGEPGLDWPSRFPPLEVRPAEPPAPAPRPVAGTPDVPLELDLDLDDMPPVQLIKSRPRRETEELPAHPVLARMLPDDPSMPGEVSPATPVDSHLIDFDLFDTGGSSGRGGEGGDTAAERTAKGTTKGKGRG